MSDQTTITTPMLDPDETSSRRARRRARRWTPSRVLTFVLAAGFFFGPLGAGVLGARAGQIENRALTPFPSLSQGWDALPQLAQWATDHLPLRSDAVRLNTELADRVFGEPPVYGPGGGERRVIEGENGRLFFAEDFAWACTPSRPVSEMISAANRLVAIAERTGAQVIFLVPPDKTTIESDLLPDSYPNAACGPAAKDRFWEQMEATPPANYVDLRQPLADLYERAGPIWRKFDSHWEPVAASEYAHQLVDRIDPRLWQTTEMVETGEESAVGDLTTLLGTPSENTYEGIELRRPGVTPRETSGGLIDGAGVAYLGSDSTGEAPIHEGQVAWFGDSFSGISFPQVEPFFSTVVSVNINSMPANPAAMARIMDESNLIVIESVERAFATGRLDILSDASLTALEQAVDQRLAAS